MVRQALLACRQKEADVLKIVGRIRTELYAPDAAGN